MATRLGEKLRELRKQRGLTLEKLADLAGLSKSYLWELENRESQRPSAEKAHGTGRRTGRRGYLLPRRGCSRAGRAAFGRGFFPRLSEA
jgi:transcriptional regulator with XRE-family HTH domain